MERYCLTLEKGDPENPNIPIARIRGGELEKFGFLRVKKFIHKGGKVPNQEFKIPDHCDSKFEPIYKMQGDNYNQPDRIYIGGASLSGKSYVAAQIARDYQEMFPENRIYMISCLDHDDNFDGIDMIRLDVSDWIDDPPEIDDFHDSLTIFDDINAFPDPELVKVINRVRDNLNSAGRHANTSVLSTSQILCDAKKSQNNLINAFRIIGFPMFGGRNHLQRFLKDYMSLDKDTCEELMNVPSRWLLINRVPPIYGLHQRGAKLLM